MAGVSNDREGQSGLYHYGLFGHVTPVQRSRRLPLLATTEMQTYADDYSVWKKDCSLVGSGLLSTSLSELFLLSHERTFFPSQTEGKKLK